MTRGPAAFRSLRAHLGPTLLLALVAGVLAAATALAVATTDAAGARAATVSPLLVLALVVVPLPAAELARRRSSTTTLARVRGVGGDRMALVVLGPPVAAVLVGAALGAAVSAGVASVVPGSWGIDPALGRTAWRWVAGTAAGTAVLAGAVCWLAGQEPLAAALRPRVRVGRTGPWAVIGPIALVVVAALAVLVSVRDGGPGAGDLVLAGSGLLGLVAGEGIVRLLARVRSVGGRTRLPVLVALRGATRVEQRGRIRAVVAAGVVAGAALGAGSDAGAWADTNARVAVGGPVQLRLTDTDALGTLRLARRLDPDGQWLMAGAVSDERQEAELRTVWLDLSRWDRVGEEWLADTPVRLGGAIDELTAGSPVDPVVGDEVVVTAQARRPARVGLAYLTPDGALTTTTVDVGPGSGSPTARAAVACGGGCVVVRLTATDPVEISALGLGATDLLAPGWTGEGTDPAGPVEVGTIAVTPDTPLVPTPSVAAVPVLTAGDPQWDGEPRVEGIGGADRAASPVGTRTLLPLVGAAGVLADLPLALAGTGASVPRVQPLVILRADTPAAVRDALEATGAVAPPLATGRSEVLGAPAVGELRARLVVALGAGSLGLLVLLAGLGRRVRAARHERAALRLVGPGLVGLGPRGVGPVEAAVLAALAFVGVVAGQLVAVGTVVRGAGLVPTGPALPPLDATTSTGATVLVAVLVATVTAVAIAVGAVVVRLLGARRSQPSVLLEESR